MWCLSKRRRVVYVPFPTLMWNVQILRTSSLPVGQRILVVCYGADVEITINATVKMTKTDERTVRSILQTYKSE